MRAYALTPLARTDVCEVWVYIAGDNQTAADHVDLAIHNACDLVAKLPWLGHTREDLTKRAVLFWTIPSYPNYFIVYRPETVPVQVVAVLHGKRNIRRILKNRLQ
jgi:plasmid stabilization system protein ParE